MPTTKTLTAESLIAQYANGIAFVAEEQPATTVDDFVAHLRDAIRNFESAGINGTEELEDAATYLGDANESTDSNTRTAFLMLAARNLSYANDMVAEYRQMASKGAALLEKLHNAT
ncbi:hypothetical protein PV677_35900 [Streptomyces sp. DE06-01C]|uniref:hypothetical protein n=1 Tax=Streptomyces sp. DE06-01C TaxID=3028656 RepID=UPI0029C20698|nr:hypothetical protein [Streptomyces sp. DE06-01C]MDX5526054.1 hypothetical protein [Streptomyces sp. DE06-01C]